MTSLQGKIFLQLSITYIAIPQYAERADYQTIYDIIQKTKGFTFYSILLLNFAQMVCSQSWRPKGVFFSESAMCFSNLKKKYSKSLSWTWNLNFPPITVNNKFKFQAQDSNLEYFYFGDLEIRKTNRTFWKKANFRLFYALKIWI